jgi:hypothetical protein
MGLLEDIDALELSDEQKATLKEKYSDEIKAQEDENSRLRRERNKTNVTKELDDLKEIGLEDPTLRKFLRRVFLSDDDEPGIVLLSDSDLELSGDDAIGSHKREEKTTAQVLRDFIGLLPRNQEGKLDLGGMALEDDNHGHPKDGEEEDEEKKRTERKESTKKWLGREPTRSRKRYEGRSLAGVGGDE